MTDNRETIEMLKMLKEQSLKSHNDTAVLEVKIDSFNFVLDKAIEALEQEPCEDWHDVPSDEMTLEQARQAVKDLRKMLPEYLEQNPCEDCISRQEVLKVLKNNRYRFNISQEGNCEGKVLWSEKLIKDDACKEIEQLPSITPKGKTGHWIKTPKAVMGEGYMWYCDKCQYEVYQDTSKNYPSEIYCPNCGAKMVKPPERENKG